MVANGYVVTGSTPGGSVDWDDVGSKPATFPPSAHTHTYASVTDKPVEYPPAAHTHPFNTITDRPSTYPPATHTHPEYEGGGGSGGLSRTALRGYVTSGDVLAQETATWAPLAGGPTFSIPAAAGDEIEFAYTALFAAGNATFWDVAVIVGGTPVRYATTGSGTPPVEGDPGIYPDYSGFPRNNGLGFTFVAEAGDIEGGNVTIGLVVKSASGLGKVYAGTAFPLRWQLVKWSAS